MRTTVCWLLLGWVVLTGAAASQDDEAGERLWEALVRQPQPGTVFDAWYDHVRAEGALSDVLARLDARDADASFGAVPTTVRGLVLERAGRWEEALAAYDAAVGQDASAVTPALRRVIVYERMRQFDDALEAAEIASTLELGPEDDLEHSTRHGRLLWRLGDADAAIAVWQGVASRHPRDRHLAAEVATLLAIEGRSQLALDAWQRAAAIDVEDRSFALQASFEIADLHQRLGRPDAARLELDARLNELDPESWQAEQVREALRQTFVREGDLEGLAASLEARVAQRADDWRARFELATLWWSLEKRDEALEAFKVVATARPSDPEVQHAWIQRLLESDQVDEGRVACDAALKACGGEPSLACLRVALDLRGPDVDGRDAREERAVERVRALRAAFPDDAPLCASLADVLLDEARHWRWRGGRVDRESRPALLEEAEACLRDALTREPASLDRAEVLAQFLRKQGRDDEAFDVWRAMANPPHETVDRLVHVASLFRGAEAPAEALTFAERAAALDPTSFRARERVADLQLEAGDAGAARTTLEGLRPLVEASQRGRWIGRMIDVLRSEGTLTAEWEKRTSPDVAEAGDALAQWLTAAIGVELDRAGEALTPFDRAMELAPDDEALARAHVAAVEAAGLSSLAIGLYENLVTQFPATAAQSLRDVVRLALEEGAVDRARAAADALILRQPDRADSFALRARLEAQRDPAARIADLRRGLKLDSARKDLRESLADALAEAGRVDEAFDERWRLLESATSPSEIVARVGVLGDMAQEQGTGEALLKRLVAAGVGSGAQADAYRLALADQYERFERPADALQALVSMSPASRSTAEVLERVASLARGLAENDTAVQAYERLADLEPTAARMTALMELYESLLRFDEATDVLVRMAAQFPEQGLLEAKIDEFLGDEETFAAALKLVDAALARATTPIPALLLRATLLALDQGDGERAGEHARAYVAATQVSGDDATLPPVTRAFFLAPERFADSNQPPRVFRGASRWVACSAAGYEVLEPLVATAPNGEPLYASPLFALPSRLGDAAAWPAHPSLVRLITMWELIETYALLEPREEGQRLPISILLSSLDGDEAASRLLLAALDDGRAEGAASWWDAETSAAWGVTERALLDAAHGGLAAERLQRALTDAPEDPVTHILPLLAVEPPADDEDVDGWDDAARTRCEAALEWWCDRPGGDAWLHAVVLRALVRGDDDFAARMLRRFEPAVHGVEGRLALAELADAAQVADVLDACIASLREALTHLAAGDASLAPDVRARLLARMIAWGGVQDRDVARDAFARSLESVLESLRAAEAAAESGDSSAAAQSPLGAAVAVVGAQPPAAATGDEETPTPERPRYLGRAAGPGWYEVQRFGFPRPLYELDATHLALTLDLSAAYSDEPSAWHAWLDARVEQAGHANARRAWTLVRSAAQAEAGDLEGALAPLERWWNDAPGDVDLLSALVHGQRRRGEPLRAVELLRSVDAWHPNDFPPVPDDEGTMPVPSAAERVAQVWMLDSRLGRDEDLLDGLILALSDPEQPLDEAAWFPTSRTEVDRARWRLLPGWVEQIGPDVLALVDGPGLRIDYGLEAPLVARLSTPQVVAYARQIGRLDGLDQALVACRTHHPELPSLDALEAFVAFEAGELARGVEASRRWLGARTEPVTVEDLTASWMLEATPPAPETADLLADLGEGLLSTSLEIQYREARVQLLRGWLGPEEGRSARAERVASVLFDAVRTGGPDEDDRAAVFLGHNLPVLVREAPVEAQGDLVASLVGRWLRDPLARRSAVRTRDGLSTLLHECGESLGDEAKGRVVEAALVSLFPDGPDAAPRLRDWRRKDPELARFPFVRLVLEQAEGSDVLQQLDARWRAHPSQDSVDLLFLRKTLADVRGDGETVRMVATALRDKTRWSNYLRVGTRRRSQGQVDKAITALSRGRAMTEDPLTWAAFDAELSRCHLAAGRKDEARALAASVATTDPEGVDLTLLWPWAIESTPAAETVSMLEAVDARLTSDPADRDAWLLSALFSVRSERLEEARNALTQARGAIETPAAPRWSLVDALVQCSLGEEEAARAAVEALDESLNGRPLEVTDRALRDELTRRLGV